MTQALYLKALSKGRRAPMGVGSWPRNGAWSERRNPKLCESGWHACRNTLELLEFLNEELYVVKLDGLIVEGDDKVAAERARIVRRLPWDDKVARLFACDVAERVLPIFEREHPDELRPRQAIETARRHANGDATRGELDAAWAAASDAAADAAGAVWAAARAAAGAAAAAARAAAAAARADAADAAGAAADAAADAADAAWAAAWDAAWAAGAAAAAAAAAADAAGAAADAADAAARQWQARRLAEVLGIADSQFDGSLQAMSA